MALELSAAGACLLAGLAVAASGRLQPALTLLGLAAVVGSLTVVAIDGVGGVVLVFPTLLAVSLMLPLVPALIVSALAVVALAVLLAGMVEPADFLRLSLALLATLALAHVSGVRLRRQRDQLLRISTVDALTGALNRRALDQRLDEIVRQYNRVPSNQCLLVLDLDGFKAVNDTQGHDRGDAVLAQIATLLRGRIRITDRLYRYGGDEFVVLASDSDLEHSRELAEELRELVGAETGVPITVSIGVAQYAVGETPAAWLRRADEALYRAKQAGRNRVDVAPPPDAEAASS